MALDHITAARQDFALIADLVPVGARILDVGCGEGDLLSLLKVQKQARVQGLELSQSGVNACVARGLSVVQGDADTDLGFYPDDAFDVVILSKTVQTTRRPKAVLEALSRIGKRVIVSFPNFGHWRVRLSLLVGGRMPMTPTLAQSWHDTDNIHLCSLRDFLVLVDDLGLKVEHLAPMSQGQSRPGYANHTWAANIFAEDIIVALTRR